jgi:hypothetical protein
MSGARKDGSGMRTNQACEGPDADAFVPVVVENCFWGAETCGADVICDFVAVPLRWWADQKKASRAET